MSVFGRRPSETELAEFRNRVKAHIAEHAPGIFLSRIDYTGRLAIKPP